MGKHLQQEGPWISYLRWGVVDKLLATGRAVGQLPGGTWVSHIVVFNKLGECMGYCDSLHNSMLNCIQWMLRFLYAHSLGSFHDFHFLAQL